MHDLREGKKKLNHFFLATAGGMVVHAQQVHKLEIYKQSIL